MKKYLLLALIPLSVHAQEYIKDIEPTVQMALTDQPCKVFALEKGVEEVYMAYVVDTAIGKRAEGCWQREPKHMVHIDIVVPDEKSYFSYRYPESDFSARPDM